MCLLLAPPCNCQRIFSVCDSQSLQEGPPFISSHFISNKKHLVFSQVAPPHFTSYHLILLHLTLGQLVSLRIMSPHLYHLSSSHLTSPHLLYLRLVSPHLSSSYRPISLHLTSSQLISFQFTSPSLISPCLHLASSHFILRLLASFYSISPYLSSSQPIYCILISLHLTSSSH